MEKKPDFGISISANLPPALVNLWGGGVSEHIHYEGNKFEIHAIPKFILLKHFHQLLLSNSEKQLRGQGLFEIAVC